jgi:hypothetical protein
VVRFSFTPRPLYPGETPSSTHRIQGRMGSKVESVVKINTSASAGNRTSDVHPLANHLLSTIWGSHGGEYEDGWANTTHSEFSCKFKCPKLKKHINIIRWWQSLVHFHMTECHVRVCSTPAREVSGSNLGLETGYSDWSFHGSLSTSRPEYYLKLIHDRFLP